MTQKQMTLSSIFTILLVLLPAFFQVSGIIIPLQIIIVFIIGMVLTPIATLIPTISNVLITMIIQYPIFDLADGSIQNFIQTPLLGFNISYVIAAFLMANFLHRQESIKWTDYFSAFLIGFAAIVIIGVTYSIILTELALN